MFNLFKKNKVKENKSNALDKDALKAGEKLVKEMKVVEETLPSNIQIDFVPFKKEKDLKNYLINFADKHFQTPKSSQFAAIKYEDGFIYEIHENGNGKGYLSEILKKLSNNEDVVLLLNNERRVRVIKEGTKIKTILMPENDKSNPTEIGRIDKLTNVYTPGTFLLFFGLSLTIVGLISLVLALFFKYVLLNESEYVKYELRKYKTPYEASLSDEMKVKRFEKISKMEYTENKGWKYYKEVMEEEK